MFEIRCDSTDPGSMRLVECPDAHPGPGEVAIAIAAAGVNRADLLQRAGHYPPPAGVTSTLGLECSGTIAEVGEGVNDLSVGQKVTALLDGGGYATRVIANAGCVIALPESTDNLIDCTAYPEALCTVWSNFEAAKLSRDEWVLIHGGSGGVGTIAIQMAKMRGARVITTASEQSLDLCQSLGADVVVDYRSEDFVDAVKQATDGRGVDVILDIIGAKYLAQNLNALAIDGRLVVIGMQGGTKAEMNLGQLLAKRATLMGTTLRSRSAAEKRRIVDTVRTHVWPAVLDGSISAVIADRIPLSEASKAHQLLEQGGVKGKILLVAPSE